MIALTRRSNDALLLWSLRLYERLARARRKRAIRAFCASARSSAPGPQAKPVELAERTEPNPTRRAVLSKQTEPKPTDAGGSCENEPNPTGAFEIGA
jgi:hypothetical protein